MTMEMLTITEVRMNTGYDMSVTEGCEALVF